ncbi:hypothetical protein N7468_009429 [Penicillium chermesinum]|uniref:ABC multidrug transporter MDR2 n=1 Tax=Penicillium chermesinum TaxID=63820 RepID=A0A9W9NHT6_9EURO|nr:uncharacterized protein N7468_009429 [Penicillium chermesinum]KAJ5220225.1 hypothetical protein N7468_009429 [Penicillium chermesinum]
MAAAGVASIGAGITMPLMTVVFGRLVANFSEFGGGNGPTKADFSHTLDRQCLYMLALFIARLGLNYINKFSFRIIGIRMSAKIRLHYLQSLFGQTVHVLDSMPSGSAAATITATANTLQLGISEKLGIFLEYMATIISAIVVAFTYSWSVTLVTSSTLLFIVLALGFLLPLAIKYHAQLTKAESKADSVAAEAFSAIRMIASCGAETRTVEKYSEWIREARQAGQKIGPVIAVQMGLIFFSFQAGFALAFWFGTKSYVAGRVDNVGTVVVVLMSVMLMVSAPLIAISKALVAASDFFAVIDTPRPVVGTIQEPVVNSTSDIIFEDVHFAYPSRPSKKILDGLNLRIQANKSTAIVGPSGSGKSTIVGLIEGWYTLNDQPTIAKIIEKKKKQKGKKDDDDESENGKEPQASLEDLGPRVALKGSISTCGHEIKDINIKWWRSQIGLVQQEPFLFNQTIHQNVASGLIGTQWEDESEEKKREMVKEACKESFADEFIHKLPDAYDTQVGESGIKLSGGQRQRIAIARSIISKPSILILDEATSSIDVRGERIVQAALERASKGRTTITIAHRLSTIRNADQIVVLQHGKIAEQGTHAALMAKADGIYKGLVNMQQLSLGEGDESNPVSQERPDAIPEPEKHAIESNDAKSERSSRWEKLKLFNSFGRLLQEQRSRFPFYALALIFSAGAATAVPLQAWFFAHVISVFSETGQRLHHDSAFWSKWWAVLAAGVGVCYFIVIGVSTNVEHFIAAVYRQEYFESILLQKISYFDHEDHATGQLTARLSSDPNSLKELLGVNTCMLLVGVFSLIGSLAISFAYGWKLALVALCVILPLSVGASFHRIRYEMQFNEMNEAVFKESSKFGAESIGAFRTVSALVMEDSICDRYENLLHGHVVSAYKKARWTSLIFAFADSIGLACQALILWYGGRLLLSGEYSVFSFFVTYMSVIQGAESAGQWLSFGPNAILASTAANRIMGVRSTRVNTGQGSSGTLPDTTEGVKIEFKDVYFKHPYRDIPIFKGLNLTIEKGQYAALVGASGSGKTSIVSLIERFYEVDDGRVLLNGQDITTLGLHEYRRVLSLVAQEPSLFAGTIRENILLGVNEGEVTEEQLHQCCRDANIHDFIISLPEGYNTQIGSKGVSLSGGQKQRLSIARAIVRSPQVLLLDEATSSLDSESEKLVQAAFERARKGRTTISVAHRLATIQNADVIYVLGEGKVLEKGTHSALLKLRGGLLADGKLISFCLSCIISLG